MKMKITLSPQGDCGYLVCWNPQASAGAPFSLEYLPFQKGSGPTKHGSLGPRPRVWLLLLWLRPRFAFLGQALCSLKAFET